MGIYSMREGAESAEGAEGIEGEVVGAEEVEVEMIGGSHQTGEAEEQRGAIHLVPFLTPRDGFGCDGCEKSFPSGKELRGCRRCDYDVCARCYEFANAKPSEWRQVFQCEAL
jgi:hypothetical protein